MDSLLEIELLETLESLILNWENEVVEFKEANNDYKKSEIGQYFSAISTGQPHYKKAKEKEKRDDREKQEGTHGHKSQSCINSGSADRTL